jgi:CTP synthase
MGGTMRLGMYPAKLKAGSTAERVYGSNLVEERHRHRYEVNNAYRPQLEEAGLVFSGTSPNMKQPINMEISRKIVIL